MRYFRVLRLIIVSLMVCRNVCAQTIPDESLEPLRVTSPNEEVQLLVRLGKQREPLFEVKYRTQPAVTGSLGLRLSDGEVLQNDFRIVDVRRVSRDQIYRIPVGKASQARDHHHEIIIELEQSAAPNRKLELVFRVFDDGVAFRYLIPKQDGLGQFMLTDELTRLTFPGDPLAHRLPLDSYTTSYEAYYLSSPISKIEPNTLIGLPLLLHDLRDASKPMWIAVTEASLSDYAGMYLSRVSDETDTFTTLLSPLPNRGDGAKVIGKTPHASPWRVLMISEDPGRLIESNIVFHLSEPSSIDDTSWIKPGKSTFPWWNGYVLKDVDFEPGLNTDTHKHYIDFCAEHGIEYHSLDGTDTAWYGGPILPAGPTDITSAVPEIDLPELLRYSKEKGVRLRLWMHWRALEPQIDEAFPLYEEWGIEGIMVDFMDRDDQEMVAFYHTVAEKAARYHLTVTWHGAYKPTGMERTWPNVLNYEAALNQEYNKWNPRATPPEHNLNAAFIRMLAGPMDYHQGGMRNVWPEDHDPRDKDPTVPGTRGHQLGMYIVYQNHLPMLVDYPAAYRGQPGLKFLAGIPTTWDETRVVHADFSECLVIARRSGDGWYVGAMSAARPQSLSLPLHFLGPGDYRAEILMDNAEAGPTALKRDNRTVSRSDTLPLELARAGGAVVRLVPIDR